MQLKVFFSSIVWYLGGVILYFSKEKSSLDSEYSLSLKLTFPEGEMQPKWKNSMYLLKGRFHFQHLWLGQLLVDSQKAYPMMSLLLRLWRTFHFHCYTLQSIKVLIWPQWNYSKCFFKCVVTVFTSPGYICFTKRTNCLPLVVGIGIDAEVHPNFAFAFIFRHYEKKELHLLRKTENMRPASHLTTDLKNRLTAWHSNRYYYK